MKTTPYIIYFALLLFIGCSKSDDALNDAQTGKPGSITRFAIVNDYMYVLDQNRILTYHIANAQEPEQVATTMTDYGLETIIAYEGTIYIGSRSALYILDISIPDKPFVSGKS